MDMILTKKYSNPPTCKQPCPDCCKERFVGHACKDTNTRFQSSVHLALNFFPAQEQLLIHRHLLFHHALALLVGCADEATEQRMRLQRLRLEFRMELTADKERVLGDLDHFDVGAVRR